MKIAFVLAVISFGIAMIAATSQKKLGNQVYYFVVTVMIALTSTVGIYVSASITSYLLGYNSSWSLLYTDWGQAL